MTEVFVPIKSYEGIYEISNYGNVRSLPRLSSQGARLKGKLLSGTINGVGYRQVSLYKGEGKLDQRIHLLVAHAFVKNEDPKVNIVVNHKDGNKTNNFWMNLEWTTYSINSVHSYENKLSSNQGATHRSSKLKAEDVVYIRSQKGLVHVDELCAVYSVHRQSIYGIWQGKYWKSIK